MLYVLALFFTMTLGACGVSVSGPVLPANSFENPPAGLEGSVIDVPPELPRNEEPGANSSSESSEDSSEESSSDSTESSQSSESSYSVTPESSSSSENSSLSSEESSQSSSESSSSSEFSSSSESSYSSESSSSIEEITSPPETPSSSSLAANSSEISVQSCAQLQAIPANTTLTYKLLNNIDCSDTVNWNNGQGFIPLLNFKGKLNGNRKVVLNLHINTSANYVGIGLIGTSENAEIYDIGIVNANIKGPSTKLGILLGFGRGTKIIRSFTTGNVENTRVPNPNETWVWNATGGLVAYLQPWPSFSVVMDSFSTANVKGSTDYTGGLVGVMEAGGVNRIERSYSSGTVSMNPEGRNGGLTTYTWSEIRDSFSAAKASQGLCYGVFGSLVNSYYSDNSSTSNCGTLVSGGADYFKGAVYSEGKAPFTQWDFNLIWEEVAGDFPRLKGFNYAGASTQSPPPGPDAEDSHSISISAVTTSGFNSYWKVTGECSHDEDIIKLEYTSSGGGSGYTYVPCVDGDWVYNEMYGSDTQTVTVTHGSARSTLNMDNPVVISESPVDCPSNYTWRHEMTDVFGQSECHAVAYCPSGRPYVYADTVSTQCAY